MPVPAALGESADRPTAAKAPAATIESLGLADDATPAREPAQPAPSGTAAPACNDAIASLGLCSTTPPAKE